MPVDPHAKRLLDMLAIAGGTDPTRLGISERRRAFCRLMELRQADVEIGGVADRTLAGPQGAVRIRIYTPAGTHSRSLPGIVYFHGGGLVAGSLDTHESLCRSLANETGCRLVSVDYRLAPEHKFPAAVVDSYFATIWTIEHAGELGIDPGRIAVAGDSAGGSLAAIVCQMARGTPRVKLALQLLLCPILDFSSDTESRRAFAEGYLLNRAMMQQDLECYVPSGVDPSDPRISPLRAEDFQGLPPAYIHTAEFDPVRDEGELYADALTHAGVEVRYTCHPGMIHLFYGMTGAVPYARTALGLIGAEIRAALV
jgi:acetyl esterase